MEDWVQKAIARWPNVPALYGWLGLDRRGRWLIRGETISRPQIIETINRNYEADAHGRWFFQNGPQRGYVALEYAPLVLRVEDSGSALITHTGQSVRAPRAAFIDEEGSLLLDTEWGAGLLLATDLEWALQRLRSDSGILDETQLMDALALPSGTDTRLFLQILGQRLPLTRLDAARAPQHLGFVRNPEPLSGE